jgi:hypothetical protein
VNVEEDESKEEDVEELDEDEEQSIGPGFASGPGGSPSSYHIAKTVSHCGVRVETINSEYQATQFLPALTTFLKSSRIHTTPIELDHFNIYNQVSVRLPHIDAVDDSKTLNHISATLATPDKPGKKGTMAHLDTALIKTDETNAHTDGTGLQGE